MRTWMQKEPKRCPYVGLTLTGATQIDPTTGLVWSCERSRRPGRDLMFPLQLNSSAGCHLWKVSKKHLSLYSSPTIRKRRKASELLQCTTSAVHTSTVRRVFVELLDDEKERLARKTGPDQEHVGWPNKCMYGYGGCECSLASALRADPEGAQFRPRPEQSCIVCACGTGH